MPEARPAPRRRRRIREGLTPRQSIVLAALIEHHAAERIITVSDIARATKLRFIAVEQTFQQLRDRRYLTRIGDDVFRPLRDTSGKPIDDGSYVCIAEDGNEVRRYPPKYAAG